MTTTVSTLARSSKVGPQESMRVWNAMANFLARTLNNTRGVLFPGFCTFGFVQRKMDAGTKGVQVTYSRSFALLPAFLSKYHLRGDRRQASAGVPVMDLNFAAVAAECGCSRDQAHSVYKELLLALGKALVDHQTISIDFGSVGTLRIRGRTAEFSFGSGRTTALPGYNVAAASTGTSGSGVPSASTIASVSRASSATHSMGDSPLRTADLTSGTGTLYPTSQQHQHQYRRPYMANSESFSGSAMSGGTSAGTLYLDGGLRRQSSDVTTRPSYVPPRPTLGPVSSSYTTTASVLSTHHLPTPSVRPLPTLTRSHTMSGHSVGSSARRYIHDDEYGPEAASFAMRTDDPHQSRYRQRALFEDQQALAAQQRMLRQQQWEQERAFEVDEQRLREDQLDHTEREYVRGEQERRRAYRQALDRQIRTRDQVRASTSSVHAAPMVNVFAHPERYDEQIERERREEAQRLAVEQQGAAAARRMQAQAKSAALEAESRRKMEQTEAFLVGEQRHARRRAFDERRDLEQTWLAQRELKEQQEWRKAQLARQADSMGSLQLDATKNYRPTERQHRQLQSYRRAVNAGLY